MGIFQRIKRIILSLISFGLIKYEDPSILGPYVIENMRKKLKDLTASAVPVIAGQYKIEHMLANEETKLAELDETSRQAVQQGDDETALNLLAQKETCQARREDLRKQLETARLQAEEAKQQIQVFQEELQVAEDRARSVQVRHQLATMRAQVQKFAMTPSLDEDIKTIEQMEERADQVAAETEAMAEISAMGEEAKVRQLKQSARKQRAQEALDELKAEMGLTDTEKRFKKVEIGESQAETEQIRQQTVGQGPEGEKE